MFILQNKLPLVFTGEQEGAELRSTCDSDTEWMSSSKQPREAKQFLKDLSQNLSGLALSALRPSFALTPPSLLTALWDCGRWLCLELLGLHRTLRVTPHRCLKLGWGMLKFYLPKVRNIQPYLSCPTQWAD